MPTLNILVETPISASVRARQVMSAFDVPYVTKSSREWKLSMPLDEKPWNVGLIVGPSGSGKSTVVKRLWGEPTKLDWTSASVVDDFPKGYTIEQITDACSAVGFNTIPAWLRPFHVLSNGEKCRVELARLLLEARDVTVVDEFTSMVDRQVAKIAANAAQKFARRKSTKLVAATCHYDVEDWLQPDWTLDMADGSFRWRSVQRRPSIACEVRRVGYEHWKLFAPFHYLTADLNKAARCFVLFANGEPAAFAGVLNFPHAKVHDIRRLSRLVTLPDWQGLGLAMALAATLGAAHRATGKRFRTYPAHRALIRSFATRKEWAQVKDAGVFSRTNYLASSTMGRGACGGRPCAVFEWRGEKADATESALLLG